MPNLKDIRKRINSVKNTRKITRAMKMVAAAKLRRAQNAIMSTRPYARRIDGLIKGLSETIDPYDLKNLLFDEEMEYMTPMLPREEIRAVGLLVISSDKGMCGAFNAGILRKADRALKSEFGGKEIHLSIIGRKANEHFKRRGIEADHYFSEVYNSEHNPFEEADAISNTMVDDFKKGRIDELWVIYNEFKSAISQEVVMERLLPIRPDDDAEAVGLQDYIYEPDRKEIMRALIPEHLSIQLYRCLLESQASEHGARMSAMEGATRNAGEMIDKLTLKYNRARQAAITSELVEIISGAEALKG